VEWDRVFFIALGPFLVKSEIFFLGKNILNRTLRFIYTFWLFNIAMENCPFIDDFPITTSIYRGFSMAMLNNKRVYIYVYIHKSILES